MNNKKQKTTHSQKSNLKKIQQLHSLNLQQLDGVSGGSPGVQDR